MTDQFIQAVSGAIASSADYDANFLLVQESLADIGDFVISGLTLSAGAGLAVTVAAGTAVIGARVTVSGSFSVAGLSNGTLNYIYLKDDGTGTSNTSGTTPADAIKIGTATTSGGAVTSVDTTRASGRQARVRTESLVHGGSAGNPRAVDLAQWAASTDHPNEVKGTLPAGALPAISLNDLSDVNLPSAAQGDILYRNATEWVRLVAGTSGFFLKTLGAGANPLWSNLVGSLAWDDLSDVTLTSQAQGDIAYRNASVWVNLPAGTTGQFLKTQGAGANPVWSGLSATDLAPAVILAPATGTRNDIQPTADVTMLRLLARVAGQTNDLIRALDTSSVAQARILASGLFSSPHGSNSERFGAGSSASGQFSIAMGGIATANFDNCAAFGYSAVTSGIRSTALGQAAAATTNATAVGMMCVASGASTTALGWSATASGASSMAIGAAAQATNTESFACGPGAFANQAQSFALGSAATGSGTGAMAFNKGATASATYAVAMGLFASATHNYSIALGAAAASTAVSQFVVGEVTAQPITDVHIGGVKNAAPAAITYHGISGNGNNIPGGNLIAAAGQGTGSAIGGDLVFQSAIAGSSGSTLNSLQEKFRISNISTTTWTRRSSTSDRAITDLVPSFVVSTDASRTGRAIFDIFDTAAREVMRFEASGSAAMIGFLGAAAVARAAAYTQTDSTTSRTQSVPTATSIATTAATNAAPFGYTTQAQADAIVAAINALIVDVRNVKSVLNSVIDDGQAFGLLG